MRAEAEKHTASEIAVQRQLRRRASSMIFSIALQRSPSSDSSATTRALREIEAQPFKNRDPATAHAARSSRALIPRAHPARSSRALIPRAHPARSSRALIPRAHPARSSRALIPRAHPARSSRVTQGRPASRCVSTALKIPASQKSPIPNAAVPQPPIRERTRISGSARACRVPAATCAKRRRTALRRAPLRGWRMAWRAATRVAPKLSATMRPRSSGRDLDRHRVRHRE